MKHKVLYIFGGEKASGAEIVMDRLIRYNHADVEAHLFISPGSYANQLLQEKPYFVQVCTALRKLNRSNTNKLKFILQGIQNYLQLSVQVLRYIHRHKIAVVHANTVVPAAYILPALILSKIFFLNIYWIWSDHDLTYFSKKDNFFARLNLYFFNKTIVVSNAVKAKYQGVNSFYKIDVLYNGLNTEIFKPDAAKRNAFRQQNGISGTTIVFGIAGNLSERKGQLSLVLCFINNQKYLDNVFLLIAGNIADEDQQYAKRVTDAVNAHPHLMKYIGHTSDMVSFYNGCDVIVSNSNIKGSEPLGTTIYEAMSCEKLVIGSDTGGTAEIIKNDENGILFRSENDNALSEAIQHCLVHTETINDIKIAARKTVLEKFNICKMAFEYMEIIKKRNHN